MKFSLDAKEIQMINDLAREMEEEASPELSLMENMMISLNLRIDVEDDEQEIQEIIAGIQDFDKMLEKAQTQEMKSLILEAMEDSTLKNFSVQTQYQVLAEILETCNKEILENTLYDMDDLEPFVIIKDQEPTQENLEELKNLVAQYLESFAVLNMEGEAFGMFFQIVGKDKAEEFRRYLDDENKKYYMALAARILQLQGQIGCFSAREGAREIGLKIAAAFASAKAKVQGMVGELPWEKVWHVLQKIAGITLLLLLSVAAGMAAACAGEFLVLQAKVILGAGAIGILALCLAAAFGGEEGLHSLADAFAKGKEMACETISDTKEMGESFMCWLKEKILPALRCFYEKAKEKLGFAASSTEEEKEDEDIREEAGDICEEAVDIQEECSAEDEEETDDMPQGDAVMA